MPAELGDRLVSWIDGRVGKLFEISARHAQRRIEAIACEAGVVASAHSLRHTTATRIYERARDLGVVQRVLGHASVATTQRYARCDEAAVRRAVGA